MTKIRSFFLLAVLALSLLPALSGQNSQPYAVSTVAGTGHLGDGGPATAALLEYPSAVAVDSKGTIYIADSYNDRIRTVSGGTIETLAYGFAVCLKMDNAGNFYASAGDYRIYKISPKGLISLVAGAGFGYSGDNGLAVNAKLNDAQGIAVDASNNVYVADTLNNAIRKITPDGIIHTIAGNGSLGYGGNGIQALSSPLAYPTSVEIDAAGNLYIGELYRIRKVAPDGTIKTIAGNGYSPVDGQAINSAIGSTLGLAVDSGGNLYLADQDYNMVRMISPSGVISTIAGTMQPGFGGDGSYAFRVQLYGPSSVALDAAGDIFIADQFNHRIREINAAGLVSTVAGATHYSGDGGPATTALLHRPEQAIKDSAGNLYVPDSQNHVVRKIDSNGIITPVAGTGMCNYSGDSGPATAASLCVPEGLAMDPAGNLYIADWGNAVIRKVDAKGKISTFSGTYPINSTTKGQYSGPYGLVFDTTGANLFVSDNTNNKVWQIRMPASGSTGLNGGTLFVGTGTAGSIGDGGLSTSAQLSAPTALAFGSDNTLYIADSGNDRIRKVTGASSGNPGIISTVLTSSSCCNDVNIGTLSTPAGIVLDADKNLYVSWLNSNVITVTTPAGQTSVFAGTGAQDYSGDGGLAPAATFSGPSGLTLDSNGDFYVADYFNNRIRKLTLNTLTGMNPLSGDAQTANAGTAVPSPLVVRLTFRGGVGVPGIPVTFAVTSGSATLSLASTVTDAQGDAGVGVTMGATPGPVVITASASGVPSVQFHLTANSLIPLPTFTASGVIGAGGSTPPVIALSPGGLATIFGSNFAPAGTFAQAGSSTLTTQLAGTCVTVDGLSAYLTFVSPGQINFQVPAIVTTSNATVQVISNCGTSGALQSAVVSVPAAVATPEFLYWVKNANGQDPVVAVNAVTGAYVGAAGMIPGVTFTPAKPGDILTIYAVSFGPTFPVATPGLPPAAAAQSIYTATVKFGPVTLAPTAVLYAGVSPGTAGLYQLNIQVPAVADGDYTLVLTLGAFSTPASGFITVKN